MTIKTYTTRSNANRAANKFIVLQSETHTVEDTEEGFVVTIHMDANEDNIGERHQMAEDRGFKVQIEGQVEEEEKKPAARKSYYRRGVSSAMRPCELVHAIVADIRSENPSAPRKVLMEACMAAGVTYGTARTQIQKALS